MDIGLVVPGFRGLTAPGPGTGPPGPTWFAADAVTGEPVALRLVPASPDPAVRERMRALAGRLLGVDHPHLVRLRRAVTVPAGLVLVHPRPDPVALVRVLAAGRLAAGEVITTLAPVAGALAALHAAGLRHGAVGVDAVRLTVDGRPRLAGAGLAALHALAAGLPADPEGIAADLAGLAGLARATGAGAVAGLTAAVELLESAGEDPAAAARFATAVLAAGRPAPLRRPPAEPGPVPRPTRTVTAAVRAPATTAGGGTPGAGWLAADLRRVATTGAGGARAGAAGAPRAAARSDRAAARERTGARNRHARRRAAVGPPSRRRRGRDRSGPPLRAMRRPVVLAAALAVVVGLGWLARGGAAGGHSRSASAGTAGRRAVATVLGGRAPDSAASAAAAFPATSPASTPAGRGRATGSGPGPGRSPSWTAVVAGLDRRRAAALADPADADWAAVDAPGSPALVLDRQLAAALARAGVRAAGLSWQLLAVRPVRVSADQVTLWTTDRLAPYRIVDGSGVPVASRAGRGPAVWTVVLRRLPGGWRLERTWPGTGPAA